MLLKEDASIKKLRGSYYTPKELSDFIVKLFINDLDIKTILEPSCGDGIFLESVVNILNIEKIDYFKAVEIVREEVDKTKEKFRNYKNIDIIHGDFILMYDELIKQKGYDLILGNPPYIRYQYLTEDQRNLQSKILVTHGMKSNKLINAWVCFLVACVQLLNENGKIAFVIPAELLQVVYAEDLRLFLSNNLSKITLLLFEELVFEGIEQEILIFIGEKNASIAEKNSVIGVKSLKNLDCLENFDIKQVNYRPITHTKEKWNKYFINEFEVNLIENIKKNERFISFRDIGIVNVGITTGNNDFFSVDKKTVEKYNLENVTLPLIGRSSHAHGIYFTHEDWQHNVNENKKAFLLNFPNDIIYEEYPQSHKDYITKGEQEEANTGYKCRIRERWYIVPSVWIPDAFFLRRNNTFPKFVLNNINAVSTDTMHRIKFNEGINRDKVLLSYYNSITFAFTEINGRSYGGGVLEILPGEVSKLILPNLQDFDDSLASQLLLLIDNCIRNNGNIDEVLDIVDREVLVNYIGIPLDTCNRFRDIWKKLMYRRHQRSK